jgi:hypothetical protein
MIRRVIRARGRVSAVLLLIALPLVPVSIDAQQSGVEFDVKTVMSASGAMSGMLAGMAPGYSGHGFALGRRFRIDIVDGALGLLAEKGDYMLFDTTGITIVRPGKKEFVLIPLDVSSKALEQIQAMGMSVTVGDVAVKLDSVPGTDTIAGYSTHHYKQTASYTLTIEGMGASQQMKSQVATEFWMATVPGLVTNPLQRASQISGGGQGVSPVAPSGPLKDLAAKLDSVSRRVTGSALRVRVTTSSDAGAGNAGLDMTSEMSNVKRATVADSLFVVPSDYTRGASPFPSGI